MKHRATGLLRSVLLTAGLAAVAMFLLPTMEATAQGETFTVTVEEKTTAHPYYGVGSDDGFVIDGVQGKALTLQRGTTYTFQMDNVPGEHLFYLTESAVGGGVVPYETGVTGSMATGNNTLVFTPGEGTPDNLFYQCGNHQYMGGQITIEGGSGKTSYTITVETKNSQHPYLGMGSELGFAVDGMQGKQLTLERGTTYTFTMDDVPSIHPFYISTSAVGAGAGQYDEGVEGNMATGTEALTFTPGNDAPDTLYYQCGSHEYMGWQLLITGGEDGPAEFTAHLNGGYEVPPNNSRATGSVTAMLDGTTLTVTGSFSGLESDFNAEVAGGAHLHIGMAGENGPVAVPLTATLNGDKRSGSFEEAENTFDLTAEQVTALQERGMYVNIHSVDLPAGEIRAQLVGSDATVYRAMLSGRAEVPANASRARGGVIIELRTMPSEQGEEGVLTVSGSFSGLGSDLNTDVAGGAHLHFGGLGENGGVIFPLTVSQGSDKTAGRFLAADNMFELNEEQIEAVSTEQYYVNIHSQDYEGGEIRGQVLLETKMVLEVNLAGYNHIEATGSGASGGLIAVLEEGGAASMLTVAGNYSNLESDFNAEVGAHLHAARADQEGSVEIALNVTQDGARAGMFAAGDNMFELTEGQMDALLSGGWYANVHTVDNPAGEIRGQVTASVDAAPAMSAVTSPGDGAMITITGSPLEQFVVQWEAATDGNGDQVVYRWQLASDAEFGTILFSSEITGETSFATTFATIEALLALAGVQVDGSVTLYHRVITSDGSLQTMGEASSVVLTRGVLSADNPFARPGSLRISGSYPNPTTGASAIRMDLPTGGNVQVEFFDILGRRVAATSVGRMAAGRDITLHVDPAGLDAGVYHYRVTAHTAQGTLSGTGRMTVMEP